MTADEMIATVKTNGFTATQKTKKEIQEEYRKYKKNRENTDALLDKAYVSDKVFTAGSRSNRTTNRQNRKRWDNEEWAGETMAVENPGLRCRFHMDNGRMAWDS